LIDFKGDFQKKVSSSSFYFEKSKHRQIFSEYLEEDPPSKYIFLIWIEKNGSKSIKI
jgi:hypothetical protein